ncbi:MAG: ROK family protein [Solirubrobacteraceae bacterium]
MPADCVIGVDLGGSKLVAGVVDGDLRVHHRAFRPAPATGAIDELENVACELIEASETPVRAIGMGIPSLMDRVAGVARWTNHLDLAGVAVADLMADRLGLPVFVDNDGNVAMLAELEAGAAQGVAHAVMLTLGTGVAGAIVVDGRLVRGARGAAGELGHIVVDLDGPPCPGNCPSRGCLEAVASGTALGMEGERAAAGDRSSALAKADSEGRVITGALVTELAHDGDPAAVSAVETIGRNLGVGLASIANALDPEVIIIGGGVIAAGELLLAPAREELERRALPPIAAAVRVVPARFGAESGMLGAALLARTGLAGG